MKLSAINNRNRILLAVAVTLAIVFLAGCQTPPSDDESEIPWNTPQDWESSPMLPGFNGAR